MREDDAVALQAYLRMLPRIQGARVLRRKPPWLRRCTTLSAALRSAQARTRLAAECESAPGR